ncbi:MAG: lipopolysaccharide biosynthesis protein [Candidatus Melainabacteria bacterium]|nr:lipopolysaccharide biosynthesis protein [Candidatus Melainabacteria bacterium]
MSSINSTNLQTNLLRRVIKNTLWMFNSSFFVRVINLIKGIILVRFLIPDDFGLFGLSIIVIGLTELFSDVGAGTSLIYRKDDTEERKEKDEEFISTAFWLNLIISTFFVLAIVFLSPVISRFYSRADLIPVLIVLALALWFQTNVNIQKNLLRRNLKFKSISIIEVIVSITSFLVAIYFAINNYGVWALVLSNLTGNILNAILICLVSKWYPKRLVSKKCLEELLPFSKGFLGQAITWYLVFNMGNLIIGKLLGMSNLGLYTIAYNYALLAVTMIANPLGNVAFPELGKLKFDTKEFWDSFYGLSKLFVGSITPIACTMFVIAPDIFPLLFGEKWNDAVMPFQILVVYGMVRCIWIDPFSASGKFNLSFKLGIVTLFFSVLGIFIGANFGIIGVATSVLFILGSSHLVALYLVSKSGHRVLTGLLGAAPYFVLAFFISIITFFVRNYFMFYISSRRELLVLVSVFTVLIIYLLIYRKNFMKIILSISK